MIQSGLHRAVLPTFPEALDWTSTPYFGLFESPRESALMFQAGAGEQVVMMQSGFHDDRWVLYDCIRDLYRLVVRVQFSSVPVLQHRSFKSGQSDDTPNPCARPSSFPLVFLLKPRKLSSPPHACSSFRLLKSSNKNALAICLTLTSSQFSMLVR